MTGNEIQTIEGANLPQQYDSEKLALIKRMYAKDCTNDEFAVFIELSKQYGLDPFSRQIWAVKYQNQPANIFCGRDGYLAIAHRSGKFNGMESGTKKDGDELVGWCKVYRSDMDQPFYHEVYSSEYNTGKSVWEKKPRTMIQKVAEAQCLRRAFSISGLYLQEEFDDPGIKEIQNMPSNLCEICKENPVNEDISEKLSEHTGGKLICRKCGMEIGAEIGRKKREEKAPVKAPESKLSFNDEPETITGEKCEECGTIETDEEIIAQAQNIHKKTLCRDCLKKANEKKAEPEPEKPKEAKEQGYKCEDCGADIKLAQYKKSMQEALKPLCNVCLNVFKNEGKEG